MNLSKARDFYSAYYEKTLDEGLRQAFERAMASDATVAAEYQQFERIMEGLKSMDTAVPVPDDLHLKIRERVDANILAQGKKSKASAWFFAWKPIAYGAVATAALIGVVASITSRSGSGVAQAGMAAVSHDEAPKVAFRDGTLYLSFASVKKNAVTVKDVESGRVLLEASLVGQKLESPITNLSPTSKVVSIGFAEGYPGIYVAVPGKRPEVQDQGTGTVDEFLAAMSGMYRTPVVFESASVSGTLDWVFESPEAISSIEGELKSLGLKAELRENGLIWISSQ